MAAFMPKMASPKEITQVNQFEVVTMLANDSVFVRNWMLLCRRLNFNQSLMYELEKMDKINSPIADIIIKIMDYWKSSSPAEANSKTLVQILRQIGCTESADGVEALMGNYPTSH